MKAIKIGAMALGLSGLSVLLPPIPAHGAAGVLGNRFFSDRRIRHALPPPPGAASAFALESWEDEAEAAVLRLYRGEGFFDAEARVGVGRDPADPDRWLTTVWIREGERYAIASAEVEPVGDAPLPPGLPAPEAGSGEAFSYSLLARDVRRIGEFLAARGRMFAEVSESVEILREETAARVRYRVRPGPVALFDTLVLDVRHLSAAGDTTAGWTRPAVLRRLAPYRPGDTVTAPRNRAFLRKLYATGAFLDLGAETRPQPGGGSAVVLHALEGQGVKYRAAASYSVDGGFGGEAALRHGNLFGSLKGAGFEFLAAQRRQAAGLDLTSALVFGRKLDAHAGARAEWYQGTPLRQAMDAPAWRGDLRFSAGAGVGVDWRANLRATEEAEGFFQRRAVAPGRVERGLFLNLIQGLHWAWLGPSLVSPRGVRTEFLWGNGGAMDGGGGGGADGVDGYRRHDWLESRTSWNLPFAPGTAFLGRIDGGFFFRPGGLNAARFFLGGSRGLRAFGEGRVCPATREAEVDGETVPVCVEEGLAPAFALAEWEMRFYPLQVWEPSPYSRARALAAFAAAAFAEAGSVWETDSGPDWSSGRTGISYGFGFRYPLSPGYEFSLDAAWGVAGGGRGVSGWALRVLRSF